jgi:hypothetical protein
VWFINLTRGPAAKILPSSALTDVTLNVDFAFALETCVPQGNSMSESFAALFEESLQRAEMRTGEVITAEVVRIEHSFVVVNAGLKSEAYVPIEEFKNDKGESKSR